MDVDLGLSLPQFGRFAGDAARIGRFAADAEAAGATSLWVGDRLLAARRPTVGYLGADTIPETFRRALDPFAVLAAAAVTTTTATLGTSVLVAPLYAPAVLARSLASVSGLSEGRFIAGLGIGWSPEEYAAADVGFDHRGARLDELLDHLEVLWSGRDETPEGRFWATPAAYVETPSPRIPIWASAFSEAALRRVGRRCDGWLPSAWIRDPAIDTARSIAERLTGLRPTIDAAAVEAGRDAADVGTVLRVNVAAGVERDAFAEAVTVLVERTGFRRVFVDPMYRDGTLTEWLATFGHVRDALT